MRLKFLIMFWIKYIPRLFDCLIPRRPIYIFSDKKRYNLIRGIVLFDRYCIFCYAENTSFKSLIFTNSTFDSCYFENCKIFNSSFLSCNFVDCILSRFYVTEGFVDKSVMKSGCFYKSKSECSVIKSKAVESEFYICKIETDRIVDSDLVYCIYDNNYIIDSETNKIVNP